MEHDVDAMIWLQEDHKSVYKAAREYYYKDTVTGPWLTAMFQDNAARISLQERRMRGVE